MYSKKNIVNSIILVMGILMAFSCKKEEDAISPENVEEWTYFSTDNGLPSNQINCIAEDSLHNIWIGTNKGLAKYDGSTFTYYSTKTGLPSDNIYSLLCSSNNVLFVGTQHGVCRISPKGNCFCDLKKSNLNCLKFCEYDFGNMVACASSYGYFIFDFKKSIIHPVIIDSTKVDGITYLDPVYDIVNRKDSIWVAAKKGIYVFTPTQFTNEELGIQNVNHLITNKELGIQNVNHLFNDRSDNLWLTSSNDSKLMLYNGSEFTNDKLFVGYNNYKAFVQDRYNNYWVSIYGYGVLNYGGGMTKVYNTASSSILSDNINALFFDSKNNLWLGSNDKGLMCFKNIKPLQFDTGDNVGSNSALNNNF
ncbi:MAG TPA: two-component regulator propeller domain-containing protein [Bacteroidales bacterium]|nr:two-component regulator propeller domain-containing protein [Bacteroidales bacterium]